MKTAKWARVLGVCGLSLAALSACDNGPSVVSRYVAPNGTKYIVDEIRAKRTPILVEVKGVLFGAEASNLDAMLHDQIPVLVRGENINATAKPTETAMPDVRIVVGFGVAQSYDSKKLCVDAEPPTEDGAGRINAVAAFCRGDRALAHSTGWIIADTPTAPLFREWLLSLTRSVIVDAKN